MLKDRENRELVIDTLSTVAKMGVLCLASVVAIGVVERGIDPTGFLPELIWVNTTVGELALVKDAIGRRLGESNQTGEEVADSNIMGNRRERKRFRGRSG